MYNRDRYTYSNIIVILFVICDLHNMYIYMIYIYNNRRRDAIIRGTIMFIVIMIIIVVVVCMVVVMH